MKPKTVKTKRVAIPAFIPEQRHKDMNIEIIFYCIVAIRSKSEENTSLKDLAELRWLVATASVMAAEQGKTEKDLEELYNMSELRFFKRY